MKEADFGPQAEGEPPEASPPTRAPAKSSAPVARGFDGKRWRIEQRRSPLKTALYMLGVLMIVFSATMLVNRQMV